MEVYKSIFLEVNYIVDYKLFHACWLPETKNMSIEEYKSEFINYHSLFKKFSIDRVLVDERKLNFMVTPDLQEWVNKNIFVTLPPFNIAIILPEDEIAQLAVEQLLDEEESKKLFATKFFRSEEEAKKWIYSL